MFMIYEAERNPCKFTDKEKRKYLFLKQLAALNLFKEQNAISRNSTI